MLFILISILVCFALMAHKAIIQVNAWNAPSKITENKVEKPVILEQSKQCQLVSLNGFFFVGEDALADAERWCIGEHPLGLQVFSYYNDAFSAYVDLDWWLYSASL